MVFSKNFVQIYTEKGAKNKFSSQFLSNSLPGVLEEGLYVGLRDLFAGDFAEAFHKQLQVLEWNFLAGSMIKSVVNFLCGHSLLVDNFEVEG